VTLAKEMRVGWIGPEFGFTLTAQEAEGARYERLWRYGDKDFDGPMPVKVTFEKAETANKFINGGRKAGLLGNRRKIYKGKYQDVAKKDLPPTYIRGGSTWDQREASRKKRATKEAHKVSEEGIRYKGAKDRDEKWTHGSKEVVTIDPGIYEDNEDYTKEPEVMEEDDSEAVEGADGGSPLAASAANTTIPSVTKDTPASDKTETEMDDISGSLKRSAAASEFTPPPRENKHAKSSIEAASKISAQNPGLQRSKSGLDAVYQSLLGPGSRNTLELDLGVLPEVLPEITPANTHEQK